MDATNRDFGNLTTASPVELCLRYSPLPAVLRTLPASVRQWCVEWREEEHDPCTDVTSGLRGDEVWPAGLDQAVPKRRHQFVMGRRCAQEALAALGVDHHGFLTRNPDGSPCWPPGVVGSITHAPGFAAAAVTHATDFIGLGIDAEPVMTEERARRVATAIAWPVEVMAAKHAGLSRLEALTLVFSAKETCFKALYPRVRVFFDFHDVRLIDVDAEASVFRVRVARTLSPSFVAGYVLEGRFDIDTRGVHTGMVLGAEPANQLLG